MIAKDFEGPDLTDDEVRESFTVKTRWAWHTLVNSPSSLATLLRSRASLRGDAGNALQASKAHSGSHVHADDEEEKAQPSDVFSPPETLIEAEHFGTHMLPNNGGEHPQIIAEGSKVAADDLEGDLLKVASLPFAAAGYAGTSSAQKSEIVENMRCCTSRGHGPECHLPTMCDDNDAQSARPTQLIAQARLKSRPSLARRVIKFVLLFKTPPTVSMYVPHLLQVEATLSRLSLILIAVVSNIVSSHSPSRSSPVSKGSSFP